MNEAKRSVIIEKAKKLLIDCGLDGTYPVPVEKIPPLLNYSLMFFNPDHHDNLLNISGAVDYTQKKILINQAESAKRQVFTIAHEIGHILLHSQSSPNNNSGKIDYRTSLYDSTDPIEAEANLFAAELLMPEHKFKKQWELDQEDTSILSSYFFVSEKAIEIRAKSLKLMK